MIRLAVVLALALPSVGCSLLFDESEEQLPDGLEPDLQFAFEGAGDDALESTGRLPLTLRLSGEAGISDGALDLRGVGTATPGLAVSNTPASEFADACQQSREFSFSVWISPGSALPLERTPARIVTLEDGVRGATDFTIGQGSNTSDPASEFDRITVRTGAPNSSDVAEAVGTGLQVGEPTWIGFSMNEIGQYELYAAGPASASPIVMPGEVENALELWNPDMNLSFGATPTGDRQWRGLIHHVDLFSHALTHEELEAFAHASDPSR